MKIKIKINQKEYQAEAGETVLEVCRREKISVATLCDFDGLPKGAVCRLCLVKTNKSEKILPACVFQVCSGLEVETENPEISMSRKINLELLWADHAGKCVSCKKNTRCELQNLATKYKIENFHFIPRRGEITDIEERDLIRDNWSRVVVDEANPSVHRTTEFCVECRRCIEICPTREFGFNHRSGDSVVGTPYEKKLDCIFCGACAEVCPTGAIADGNILEKIISDLDDLKKMAVAVIDPAILEKTERELPGIGDEEKLIGFLRKIGFERVFELEEGVFENLSILAGELEKGRKEIFMSHCPSFNLLLEKYHPEFFEKLSSAPLPDEAVAKKIKTVYARKEKINSKNIVAVSISDCVAKKTLKGGFLDYVLTSRELGRISRSKKIDLEKIKKSSFDKLEKEGSLKNIDKNIKEGRYLEAFIQKSGLKKLNTVSVSGFLEAEEVVGKIKRRESEYDLIECLICEGGCLRKKKSADR